ncbi:unknown [Bifidobacterium bifidum CAG:234]|nr:unknown [Bifidobacterium bifidum CAG:234]
MQSGRVAPVDNSRNEEEEEGGEKRKGREGGEERKKKKSLDHGVKGLRAAYFMRLRRTY